MDGWLGISISRCILTGSATTRMCADVLGCNRQACSYVVLGMLKISLGHLKDQNSPDICYLITKVASDPDRSTNNLNNVNN